MVPLRLAIAPQRYVDRAGEISRSSGSATPRSDIHYGLFAETRSTTAGKYYDLHVTASAELAST
jgi:hypothetical protein